MSDDGRNSPEAKTPTRGTSPRPQIEIATSNISPPPETSGSGAATPQQPGTIPANASSASCSSTGVEGGVLSPTVQRAVEGMAKRQPSTPMIASQVALVIPDNMRKFSFDNVKLQKKKSLGKGGFAEVVLGEAPAHLLGPLEEGETKDSVRKVAVKVMEKGAVNRSTFVNLQAEVDICATLSHPCLINTHGIFEDAEKIYIVMDLCEGGELFKYMKQYGLEDMPIVAPNFVGEVVLGLEFMLEKGIIHRDVKPENLLLTGEYHVKLADFGTCCPVDSPDQKFTGTAFYVAPETIATGKGSPTSDVWSLGCVLYQLFVGRPPFEGESQYLVLQNIKQRKFEFPPLFPPDARDLVDKMLTLDPSERIGAKGFAEIKAHPFFSKVDWANITTRSNVTHLNANYSKKWETFLLQDERVVYSSKIIKERYMALSVKERILILTDFPRLFYLEPDKLVIKGQVQWSDDIAAEAASETEFHIHTGTSRTYHFVDSEKRAHLWAAKINDQVMKSKGKKR